MTDRAETERLSGERLEDATDTAMGTMEKAIFSLAAKTRIWRKLRQPLVASPAEQKARDLAEREARFQVANAALHWLWHQENQRKS